MADRLDIEVTGFEFLSAIDREASQLDKPGALMNVIGATRSPHACSNPRALQTGNPTNLETRVIIGFAACWPQMNQPLLRMILFDV